MAKDYSDVPDLETARSLLIAYDETTRKCVDEIERLQEEHHDVRILNEQYYNENEILIDEIERLRIHYDGTIMYGNRLVDLIDWAERNGIDFPAKIYNPCVIAIDHFRNERERLKDSK